MSWRRNYRKYTFGIVYVVFTQFAYKPSDARGCAYSSYIRIPVDCQRNVHIYNPKLCCDGLVLAFSLLSRHGYYLFDLNLLLGGSNTRPVCVCASSTRVPRPGASAETSWGRCSSSGGARSLLRAAGGSKAWLVFLTVSAYCQPEPDANCLICGSSGVRTVQCTMYLGRNLYSGNIPRRCIDDE